MGIRSSAGDRRSQTESEVRAFYCGKFVAPKSNKYFDSINPATEETLAEIALANQADVDAAYQAAQKAFGAWSKLPGAERGSISIESRD